jgi:hypothetical protein
MKDASFFSTAGANPSGNFNPSIIQTIVYPNTAVSEGIARLIQHKFDQLNPTQQIYAEITLREAKNKITRFQPKSYDNVIVKPKVIYTVFDHVDDQSDEIIRGLWSNLVSRELSDGSVHPEIAKLLGELTPSDIMLLADIYSSESQFAKALLISMKSAYVIRVQSDEKTFHHNHLQHLNLIERVSGKWLCTVTGKELMRSISSIEFDVNKTKYNFQKA